MYTKISIRGKSDSDRTKGKIYIITRLGDKSFRHSHYTRSFTLMNAVYQFIRKRVSSRQGIRGDTTPGNRIIHAAARETSSWR